MIFVNYTMIELAILKFRDHICVYINYIEIWHIYKYMAQRLIVFIYFWKSIIITGQDNQGAAEGVLISFVVKSHTYKKNSCSRCTLP